MERQVLGIFGKRVGGIALPSSCAQLLYDGSIALPISEVLIPERASIRRRLNVPMLTSSCVMR